MYVQKKHDYKYKKIIKCRDTGETAKGYQLYLHTLHWQYIRRCVANRAKYKCEMCHKKLGTNFTVHHLTYRRLGHERLSDLMCLCQDCHSKQHADKKFL